MPPTDRPTQLGVDHIARSAARKGRIGHSDALSSVAGIPINDDPIVIDSSQLTRTERHVQAREQEDYMKAIQVRMMNVQASRASQSARVRRGGFTRRTLRNRRALSGLTKTGQVYDWTIAQICLADPTKKARDFPGYRKSAKKPVHAFGVMGAHTDRSGRVKNSHPLAA